MKIKELISRVLFYVTVPKCVMCKEKLDYTDCSEQLREVHFAKEEKRQRYELLKERLKKELAKKC